MGKKIQILSSIRCDVIEKCLPLKSVIYFKDQLTVIFDSLCVVFCYIFLGIWVRKYKSWVVSGDVIEKCLKWLKTSLFWLVLLIISLIVTYIWLYLSLMQLEESGLFLAAMGKCPVIHKQS